MSQNDDEDMTDADAPADAVGSVRRRRSRVDPEERRRAFLAGAVELFSEVGFEAGTRDLAVRLGVTQPLLYRYFPSKNDLIAAVYQEIYVDRWRAEWNVLLTDESRPLRDRLVDFYEAYTDTIFTREWLRIYLFAGLRGVDINKRYVALVEQRVFEPIVQALRRERGAPTEAPASPEEIEHCWTLHGGVFYYGVRKHIFGFEMAVDKSRMIENALDAFIAGAARVFGPPPVSARSSRRRP